MKVEGTRSFSASRQVVWSVLNDPERMARTMPGVESFDVQDERNWRANVQVPLGLGALRMSIDFEKTDERKPDYARLHAKGKGVGALLSMDTAFHLSDEGAGTQMRWEAEVRVAGPVGSMGQRVLQPIVNQQVQNVLAALDEQVNEAAAAGSGPELQGVGPPADADREPDAAEDEGSSGAEEGLSPWDEESYSPEPEGPSRPDDRTP
jgi:carbon monoxide dehydrogenase subunit G